MNVSDHKLRRDQRGNWSAEFTIESERLPMGKVIRVTVMKRANGITMSSATCGKLERTNGATCFSFNPFFDYSVIIDTAPRCTIQAVECLAANAKEQAADIIEAAANYYLTKPAKVAK